MIGTAYPQVKLTTGANVVVLGFVINDADTGQEVAIHQVTNGSAKCKALAGASITRGNVVMSDATAGRIGPRTASATNQHACGLALEDGADDQLIDILPCYFVALNALA
jgi:hypothetical protein